MSHLNATLWYIEYQTLVFQVPSIGILNTKVVRGVKRNAIN